MKNKKIPSNALFCQAGGLEFKAENNDKGKFAVKLLARSAKPISHWYWGNVVHDIEGVKLNSKIPIDYAHNDNEVIGYLSEVEKSKEGLYLSGFLVSFKDDDRAAEINHKLKSGVPYQASINFSGDVEVEQLQEGQSAKVNGFTFKGPGAIVRKWDLRGVAVCPYGADPNTKSRALGQSDETTVNIKENQTMEKEKLNESKAQTDETKTPVPEAAKQNPGAEKELSAPVAAPAPAENPQPEQEKTEAKPADKQFSLSDFKAMADKFGNDIASKTVLSGGTFADAQAVYIKGLEAENAKLKKFGPVVPGQRPVAFSQAPEEDKPESIAGIFSSHK